MHYGLGVEYRPILVNIMGFAPFFVIGNNVILAKCYLDFM